MILEFAFDDLMRIKTWHFTIRQYRELIPRSILAMHVSVTSLACDRPGLLLSQVLLPVNTNKKI